MSDEPLKPASTANTSPPRDKLDLFLVSVLILFLELACIRWFPAHVLFLTFFTNTVLLACFLGMSLGCLAAGHSSCYLRWTPYLLGLGMAVGISFGQGLEGRIDVGNQQSPQYVYFGAEYLASDISQTRIPIELIGGFFFLIITLTLVGPGQELGRALTRVPNRVGAYTLNITGSLAGIVLFAGCSWLELGPFWWFLPVTAGIVYFLCRQSEGVRITWPAMVVLGLVLILATATSGTERGRDGQVVAEHFWSPYYRIDFQPDKGRIWVNLIGHQEMVSRERRDERSAPAYAYALPYALGRDARQVLGEKPRPPRDVLIIGAGSGNDVSRALQWGAEHVDAVEIDPIIWRLGKQHHPDRPYDDPRVTVFLDDGRNFLRSTERQYDLIVYALVDSLVLQSSYSDIRLESYLFTRQAFEDVRRCLKPDGVFVMYNLFRQGWIVARLHQSLEDVFGKDNPMFLCLPTREVVHIDDRLQGATTVFFAGETRPLKEAFRRHPEYHLPAGELPGPDSPNGFQADIRAGSVQEWIAFAVSQLNLPAEPMAPATDDWPFLYLHHPMIPDHSLRGAAIMGGLAIVLLIVFLRGSPSRGGYDATTFTPPSPSKGGDDATTFSPYPPPQPSPPRGEGEEATFPPRGEEEGGEQPGLSRRSDTRQPDTPRSDGWAFYAMMFFLGAGFMLIETKAVVHMALLFGSTWMVNSVVFFAILVMILLANLFVLKWKPERLGPCYLLLVAALLANVLMPLDSFLGMNRLVQVIGSCSLVFAPVLFAGVIFAVSFRQSAEPARAFAANIAGAMAGGLAEYSSMLLGFQNLVLVALAFYLLSVVGQRRQSVGVAPAAGSG